MRLNSKIQAVLKLLFSGNVWYKSNSKNFHLWRWDSLQNYLHDPKLLIDNNPIENAIPPLALGRKNYLFAGSHDAAKNIAMYYSFFATCQKQEINPTKWLRYILENLNDTKSSQLYMLLPQHIDKKLVE